MSFLQYQYNEAFDLLAFDGAKEKLHKILGYPIQVLDFKYRQESVEFLAEVNLSVLWWIRKCSYHQCSY